MVHQVNMQSPDGPLKNIPNKFCWVHYNPLKSLAIWSFIRRILFFSVQSIRWTCKVPVVSSPGEPLKFSWSSRPGENAKSRWSSPPGEHAKSRWSSQKKNTKKFSQGTKQPPKVLGHLVLIRRINFFSSAVHQMNIQSPDGPLKKNRPRSFAGYKTTPQSPWPFGPL